MFDTTALETVLWALHHITTLLFGVFSSATLVDVELNRRHTAELLGVSAVTGAAFAIVSLIGGEELARQLYPLCVHVPLGLFLFLRYRKRPAAIVLAITSAYLCCQISNWAGLAAYAVTESLVAYFLARIVTTGIVFYLVLKHATDLAAQLADKSATELAILLMLPLFYYIFDYATTVYTSLLHSGSVVTVEFLAFALCMFYVLFLVVYLREYEAKENARRTSWLVEARSVQATKELDAWRRSARELSVLRHDMRHYLRGISMLLDEGQIDLAREHLDEICNAVEHTAVKRRSLNETVNIALSSFDEEIERRGIAANFRVTLPEQLPVPEVELFCVLSNALENAIAAAREAPEGHRAIDLNLSLQDGQLLLEISNTFGARPRIVDDVPQATRNGHGFGTQSIRLAVEHMDGNCRFDIVGDRFVLRAVI